MLIKECTQIFLTETWPKRFTMGEIIAPVVFRRVIFALFGTQKCQLGFLERK